ncbi:MAG: FKBP-type peptidyl-prolyl cis-trans isomerase [Acidiferrobacterales bacterium]
MTGEMIAPGSRVALHFSLHLRGETLVDESRGGDPLVVTIGQGDLDTGLEQRLLGLQAGDRRHFEIAAGEAYGPRLGDNIHNLRRDGFPKDMDIKPGMVVGFELPSGEEVPGTVITAGETEVVIDFSHPLAGHDLVFDVEILSVEAG